MADSSQWEKFSSCVQLESPQEWLVPFTPHLSMWLPRKSESPSLQPLFKYFETPRRPWFIISTSMEMDTILCSKISVALSSRPRKSELWRKISQPGKCWVHIAPGTWVSDLDGLLLFSSGDTKFSHFSTFQSATDFPCQRKRNPRSPGCTGPGGISLAGKKQSQGKILSLT